MNRIKELRKNQKLSQKELSTILKVNVPTISKYESGDVDISASKLKILSNLFNTSIDYILGTDVQQVPINLHMFGDDSEEYSQREKNLIKKYRTLPDAAKDFIDMTVDASYQRVQNEKKSKRNNA